MMIKFQIVCITAGVLACLYLAGLWFKPTDPLPVPPIILLIALQVSIILFVIRLSLFIGELIEGKEGHNDSPRNGAD